MSRFSNNYIVAVNDAAQITITLSIKDVPGNLLKTLSIFEVSYHYTKITVVRSLAWPHPKLFVRSFARV